MENNNPAPPATAAQPPQAPTSAPAPTPPPQPMPKPYKSKIPLIVAVVVFFVIAGTALYFAFNAMNATKFPPIAKNPPANFKPHQVDVCPKDTKTCPNGIKVGRLAPVCAFAPCTGKGAPVATLTPSPIQPTKSPPNF